MSNFRVLDTSGHLGANADGELLEHTDLVLLDIKAWNPERYRNLTGGELRPTLEFAERLAALRKPVWLRYVLVPALRTTWKTWRNLPAAPAAWETWNAWTYFPSTRWAASNGMNWTWIIRSGTFANPPRN